MLDDRSTLDHVRRPTAPAPTSQTADQFIAGHMARTRWLVVVIVVLAVVVVAAIVALGGSPRGRIFGMVGMGLVVVAAVALSRLTADPARFSIAGGLAAWLTLVAGISVGGMFFGVVSGAAAAHVIAITFVTMSHDSRIGLWVTLMAAASTLVLGGAIVFDLMADPGVIRLDQVAPVDRATLLIAEVAVIVAGYVVAATSRRATRETVAALDAAIRQVARREALLEEARAELDAARQIGDPGRFSAQVLGSYRLGEVIGRGGMGEVYAAVHVETGAEAAVKLMRRDALGDARALARFEREGRILVGLRAPHVVAVFEIGAADAPLPYIAMQRLRGRDLAEMLRDGGTLAPSRLVAMVAQVARGIDAAHAAGVIHRDLKPANLVWEAGGGFGTWTVIDFGVARGDDGHGTLTADRIVGTPTYMAPEQATDGTAAEASDRYALAVVAFRALTGVLPHRGADAAAYRLALLTLPAAAPGEVVPDLPDAIDLVFAIALARDPGERFASCAAFATALDAAFRDALPAALEARGLVQLHRARAARMRGRAAS